MADTALLWPQAALCTGSRTHQWFYVYFSEVPCLLLQERLHPHLDTNFSASHLASPLALTCMRMLTSASMSGGIQAVTVGRRSCFCLIAPLHGRCPCSPWCLIEASALYSLREETIDLVLSLLCSPQWVELGCLAVSRGMAPPLSKMIGWH